MMQNEINTRRIALAAFALANGGKLLGYETERGEFRVTSLWPANELAVRFAASPERGFDDHVIRLRDLKRSHSEKGN